MYIVHIHDVCVCVCMCGCGMCSYICGSVWVYVCIARSQLVPVGSTSVDMTLLSAAQAVHLNCHLLHGLLKLCYIDIKLGPYNLGMVGQRGHTSETPQDD